MRKRVVITGMGIVCSAGDTRKSFAEALSRGKPCFSNITHPKLRHLRARFAGFIPGEVRGRSFQGVKESELDRFHLLALDAAGQALEEAFKGSPLETSDSMGIVVGTCNGPILSIERMYESKLSGTPDNSETGRFVRSYDGLAKLLSHAYSISGMSATVVTACSASLAAIGIASDLIRLGALKSVLVGGSDTVSPTTLAGFDGLKATTETLCAPFSKPFGLSLGEGAAFLVLEELEHALDRNAAILAEVAGFGLSNDAYHCTAPDPTGEGQMLAMQRALHDAGLSPEAITYINAHGTGTEANDKTETKAIKRVFGPHADTIPVSSTKSMVGHCLGAAGSLETIATIAARHHGVFPPTANFSGSREGCTLDYIPDAGRPWNSNGPVLTNNFAFGGNNASLVFFPTFDKSRTFPDHSRTNPVVITACGIVCAAGIGAAPFISAVNQGSPALQGFSTPAHKSCYTDGTVERFDMNMVDRRIDTRHMDKASMLATAATRLALKESVYFDKATQRGKIGFFLHCATGSTQAESEYVPMLLRQNFHMQQVTSFPYVVPNSISGNVCKALMLTGHNATFCLGGGAGLLGLFLGWQTIRSGHADALLSGSVDEIHENSLTTPLPSDLGPIPSGDGSCVFLLESMEHAQGRNAKILGEIASISCSTDSSNLLRHDARPLLLQKTIDQALSEANVSPSQIGAIGYNTNNYRERDALSAMFKTKDFVEIDVSPTLGTAAATLPLYNIAYGLLNSSIEPKPSKNYFLAVFSSIFGVNCAAVIRKV